MGTHWLDVALELFERAGDRADRVNELKLQRRRWYEHGFKDMHPTTVTLPMSQEFVTHLDSTADLPLPDLFAWMVGGPPALITRGWCMELQQTSKSVAPLRSTLPVSIMRSPGATVQPSADDLAELSDGLHYAILASDILLGEVLRRVLKRDDLSQEDVVTHLRSSGNCRDENLDLIQIGLSRAWGGDLVSAIHVLVPQLEDVLRALLPRVGVDPMVRPEAGITEEATLGRILTSLQVAGVMTEEHHFLFDAVLANPVGLNLRNDVAHGLIRSPVCSVALFGRVLQLYALVASWRVPA